VAGVYEVGKDGKLVEASLEGLDAKWIRERFAWQEESMKRNYKDVQIPADFYPVGTLYEMREVSRSCAPRR
jgi:hypothetical protein